MNKQEQDALAIGIGIFVLIITLPVILKGIVIGVAGFVMSFLLLLPILAASYVVFRFIWHRRYEILDWFKNDLKSGGEQPQTTSPPAALPPATDVPFEEVKGAPVFAPSGDGYAGPPAPSSRLDPTTDIDAYNSYRATLLQSFRDACREIDALDLPDEVKEKLKHDEWKRLEAMLNARFPTKRGGLRAYGE